MFKLRNVRPRDINKWRIGLNNTTIDKRAHTKMVALDPRDTFELATGKDQSTKVFVNGLEKRFRGCVVQASRVGVLTASVAIYTDVVSQIGLPCATERFDGEDVAFLHALVGLGLDEGNLLVAVDAVAEDIVAGDVADGFDGDCFAVEVDLVTLHYFLDGLTNVVDPGVNACLL